MRVARNRWRDLESAPPPDWVPDLTHTTIAVSTSALAAAQTAADTSDADVLILTEQQQPVADALVTRLLWWQHSCDYVVCVATNGAATDDDWLTRYQRETDDLNRAGFEAWRGGAAGTLAVRRRLFAAAGGLTGTVETGWQLELAYRLAQRGAVFVADQEATEARPPALEATTDVQEVIPLLPERRADWRRTHRVPLVHVVLDCAATPAATATTLDGILHGEYRDVAVSVVGAPAAAVADPNDDPRVHLVDEIPATSFPIPFRLEIPAGCVLQPFSIRRMLNRMRESQLGLYQALVEPRAEGGHRSYAVRLLRTAAVERSRYVAGDNEVDDTLDELFGSIWVDGRRFGLRHHADSDDDAVSPEDSDATEGDDEDESDDDESDDDD